MELTATPSRGTDGVGEDMDKEEEDEEELFVSMRMKMIPPSLPYLIFSFISLSISLNFVDMLGDAVAALLLLGWVKGFLISFHPSAGGFIFFTSHTSAAVAPQFTN